MKQIDRVIRVTPQLHRHLKVLAARRGDSMARLASELLREALERRNSIPLRESKNADYRP